VEVAEDMFMWHGTGKLSIDASVRIERSRRIRNS
jgi:hypothetical protein